MDLSETRFLIIRHGETEWNVAGRWQGWEDSPLTETGRTQAVEAAVALRDTRIEAIYCSVTGRARDTAEIIASGHNVDVQPVEALKERFAGKFEGLTTEEILQQFPGSLYDPVQGSRENWQPHGGETLKDVAARVKPFLQETALRHPNQTVVLVTHSIVVRVIDQLATSHEWETTWERVPANCCVFEIAVNSKGDFRVVTHHHDGFCELPEPDTSTPNA